MKKLFVFLFFLLLLSFHVRIMANKGVQYYLQDFPYQAAPIRVGEKLSHRFLNTKHMLYGKNAMHYAEVCTWYGALRFSQVAKDSSLCESLVKRFDPILGREHLLQPAPTHVDFNMFGCLPLRIYSITGNPALLKMGLHYADSQWELPPSASQEQKAWASKGYSWQTRLWIDDMYMIPVVQLESYQITREPKYLERASEEMIMYLDRLQKPSGLFYHAPDVPFYWARGNGWVAVGMAEVLSHLPKGSSNYNHILKCYRKMMDGLRKNINRDGLWNQLIDRTDFWTETSGSAMFTYAMILGIKKHWLPVDIYGPIVRRAWISLCDFINDEGDVTEVCIGTGKKNNLEYYRNRDRITGDYHGQAPMIWCATALMENDN